MPEYDKPLIHAVDDGGNKVPVTVSMLGGDGGVSRTYLDFPTTTFSASGDNTVIAAPGAGQKLFISDYKIQNNTTTNAVALVKKGATIIDRVKCASEGDGVVRDYDYNKELELPENTAFVVNLSAAVEFFISGRYRVASV